MSDQKVEVAAVLPGIDDQAHTNGLGQQTVEALGPAWDTSDVIPGQNQVAEVEAPAEPVGHETALENLWEDLRGKPVRVSDSSTSTGFVRKRLTGLAGLLRRKA